MDHKSIRFTLSGTLGMVISNPAIPLNASHADFPFCLARFTFSSIASRIKSFRSFVRQSTRSRSECGNLHLTVFVTLRNYRRGGRHSSRETAGLTAQDIQPCIGAEMSRERHVPTPVASSE